MTTKKKSIFYHLKKEYLSLRKPNKAQWCTLTAKTVAFVVCASVAIYGVDILFTQLVGCFL